jgi:TetR/AcrR family transcriptional regulator
MTRTKTRDPEATRNALLDAAERVFLEKGYGNAALSEIAREARVTKSLIHHYFGSKGGLWREVKMRRFSKYADTQAAMLKEAGTPSTELLRESIAFFFNFLKNNQEMVRIMAWMFLERDQEECFFKDQQLNDLGVAKLKEMQEAGMLRPDVDARFILFTFVGLAQHWFQDRAHFLEDFDTAGLPDDLDQAYLDAIQKIFFEGVLRR